MSTTSNTSQFAATFEAAKNKLSAQLNVEAAKKAEKVKLLTEFAKPVIEFMFYLDSLPEVNTTPSNIQRSFFLPGSKRDVNEFQRRINHFGMIQGVVKDSYHTILGYIGFAVNDDFKCVIDIGKDGGCSLLKTPYDAQSFTDPMKFIEHLSDLVAKYINIKRY